MLGAWVGIEVFWAEGLQLSMLKQTTLAAREVEEEVFRGKKS